MVLVNLLLNKGGSIITANNSLWLQNSSQHGFGYNSTPAIYFANSPVLNFTSTGMYPETGSAYDLGKNTNLFRNIFQTTTSTGSPSTSDYPFKWWLGCS